MAAENLADVVTSLTPEEQDSVRQFIDYLKRRGVSHPSPFLLAAEEFIAEHPELLRRLAQ
jgi:ABC-type nitrate/sulfonate/bicarbonate transport system substrate-binding protein